MDLVPVTFGRGKGDVGGRDEFYYLSRIWVSSLSLIVVVTTTKGAESESEEGRSEGPFDL